MRRLLLVASLLSTAIAIESKILHEWKYVDFVAKLSSQETQNATDSDDYNKTSIILYDVDIADDGRMFVTSIRNEGVPASVMTVTDQMGEGGPLLSPYPDWSWYKNNENTTDCNGKIIISVFRVFIKCNHIFVLDCGKIGEEKVCPARLLIFDLYTNLLVKLVIIPDNVATNENGIGLLVTPVVYARDCIDITNNAIVYMADTEGHGLVTWNARESTIHRTESNYMKPNALDSTFTIANNSFFLDDGILGLTLMKNDLYYADLAGTNMYKINSTLLQDSLSSNETDASTVHAGILQGQTGPIASKECAIFFSNIPQTSILCADSSKPINFNNTEVVLDSEEDLQFPSGLKVITRRFFDGSNQLIALTNRYQVNNNGISNLNETNFRIISINLDDVKKETNCFASCDTIIFYESDFYDISWNIDFKW
ncbi:major royal jelly protein 3-like [Pseudomyrmex gracilis]|uniref:major royal jelly protein 3-like n=1 Tax=Pseudomyrmex gracilis TaxID=219809 RepID=UPI000994FA22|nr:major royal jelly protein 3-like [Pseudomyrmex gracilis]